MDVEGGYGVWSSRDSKDKAKASGGGGGLFVRKMEEKSNGGCKV
ncbi:hypothetical protein A2U01_0074522 [Trifolium medium]|uniref:Uncharacterized protein n=1 Tax=Trifolium medium TaxID=97028 RepID=A0A392SZF0_9FABA|nr:hypothetical protein [Trifolium medium]